MSIVINHGSGPVSGASREHAAFNMGAFVVDLGLDGVTVTAGDPRASDGRYNYWLTRADRQVLIEMPGIELERVRFTDAPEQNIWDFPRLYVDGSSFVWCWAINNARAVLVDE